MYRWLAYGHPAFMVVALGLSLVALRSGLLLRRARLRKRPAPPGTRAGHIKLAKVAVAMLLVGFVLGPLSTFFLRGWTPFDTFHGVSGGIAGVLFALTAARGRALERGPARGGKNDPTTRDMHAILALASVAFGAMAAFAGFVLLP